MTPDRFRALLAAFPTASADATGVSQRGFSHYLGTHQTTVRRWASGEQPIPEPVATWLEKVARPLLTHPLPKGWIRKG